MRKRQMRVAAGCIAAVMALTLLLPGPDASAGRKTKKVSDDFDNVSTLDSYDSEIWSEYGSNTSIKTVQLTEPGRVLQFKGKKTNGETTVLMSKEWYWEVHSLSFDVKIPENGSWMGLDFVDIDEPEDYVGNFKDKGEPMCYGSLKMSSGDDFGIPGTDWTYWGFSQKELSDTWVSVKIVSDGERTGKIYMAPQGRAFNESRGQEITLGEGQSFHNCNVVFLDYAFSGYMLDNVVINTDTGVYEEDFEDEKNDLLEGITIEEDTTKFSFQIVEDGAVRKLSIADAAAGDRLISNTAIKNEDEYLEDSEEVLNTSFTIDFSGANANEEIAYVFGLQDINSDPFAGAWAYVMNRNGARLAKYAEDGTENVAASHYFGRTLSGDTVTLSLTKDGHFKVLVNGGQVLACDGVSGYGGYTGFAAKTAVSNAVYVDDVKISNHIYDVITTKSFSDDFSKNRLGTPGNSDYAYHAESGSITVYNGELSFDGCLDNTYFGPAYEYETFEMSFKLTSILGTDNDSEKQNATAPDRWIGIDFGKQSATAKQYGTYGMFLIRITHPEGETNWETAESALWRLEGSSQMKGETLTKVRPIPASYFKDITYDGKTTQRDSISPDAAVCFKIVALENRMELYMKRADEENYTLYMTVDGVNPAGWTAITCTGWTFWTIDDFEIKNTATVYHEAPEVVIEDVKKVSYEERGIGVKDTWWEEEQCLNQKKGKGISPVVWISSIVGIAAVGTAAGVLYRTRKKKAAEETDTQKKEGGDTAK